LKVVVFSGDGDIAGIGGNHLIHACRRNMDMTVICVNNFNYAMTGGQHGPTSPVGSNSPTTPAGVSDRPFNLPRLALALGANYVARWTSLHVRQLQRSMQQALNTPGFTFIEILSPCPIGYGKSNGIGDGLDEMRHYRDHCVVDDKASIYDMEIDLRADAPVVLGVFRRDGERKKPRD
ncbi:MAG: thiamine pyrophosphate-dependent enzyme, partial [Chloroflexota bacterium]|nr:thiamine pyrophosphate-dependent enzyme [Chloroflexota bacterium]